MSSKITRREQEVGTSEEWMGVTLENTLVVNSAYGVVTTYVAGPTEMVAEDPIEYEADQIHLRPEYMEGGTPYGFILAGRQYSALRRSDGSIDVYAWEQKSGT